MLIARLGQPGRANPNPRAG